MKTPKNISPETIKAYLAGTLSHAQTYAFERAMLNDAVLSDMVEGYELLRDNKTDLKIINSSLLDSLNKKIHQEETEIYPLWRRVPLYIRAASVLLFLGVGSYLLINKNEDKSIEKLASIPSSQAEKITVAKPVPPVENPVIRKENAKLELEKIASGGNKIAVQKSKAKVLLESAISSADVVAMERKKESENIAIPESSVAYESVPEPVPQAPKMAAPSGVMKSENRLYSKRKSVDSQVNTNIISGTVLDEDSKQPVPNVSLFSNEKSVGKTDENGQFNLDNAVVGNKINLVAPNFENTEININKNASDELFIRPKAELIFIDLKRNKIWKYNPSEHSAQPTVSPDDYVEYLQKNLKKPKQAIDNQIVGNVTVEFNVNKEGKLSDFKIIKSLGYGCDEEAIRAIKDGPIWMPKMTGGEPRRQRVRQEVNF